jgi:hypothetical protein
MYKHIIKRLLDFILSAIVIVVSVVPMVLVALAIVIDDPGPVFFKQKRVGKNKNGKTTYFLIWKFRSMKMSTPHDVPTHLLENPEQYTVEKEGPFNKCIGFNRDTDITLWKGKDGVYTLDYGSFLKTKRKDIADKWIEKYNLDTTDKERLDQLTKGGIGLVPWGLPLVEDKDQTNWNKKLADTILPPHGYNR